MKTVYVFLAAILMTIFCLGISSCSGYECETFSIMNHDEFLDTAYLEKDKTYYLPRNNEGEMKFSNGLTTITLDSFDYKRSFEKRNLNYKTKHDEDCGSTTYYEYSQNEYEQIEFQSAQVPLIIQFCRKKLLYWSIDKEWSAQEVRSAKDLIRIRINNQSFSITFDTNFNKLITFYPSYQLNNIQYDSVYKIDTHAPASYFTTVTEVFYNTSMGLLGYNFKNGEKWVREW